MRVSTSNNGFSLVELLCATAVIATLTVVAVNASGVAMEQSRSVECLSNLRQIGTAMQLYVGDFNGRLPSSGHDRDPDGTSRSWVNTLSDYLGPDFIGRCPDQKNHPAKVSYGWNDLLTEDPSGVGIPVVAVRQPSATIAVVELAGGQTSEHLHFRGAIRNSRLTGNQFRSFANTVCHGLGSNYLFADGRAEKITWTEVQRRLAPQNSNFINP